MNEQRASRIKLKRSLGALILTPGAAIGAFQTDLRVGDKSTGRIPHLASPSGKDGSPWTRKNSIRSPVAILRGRDPQTGRPTFRTLRSADPKDNHHISFHHHTQVFGPNPTKFAMDLIRKQNIQSAINAVQNGVTLRHTAQ